MFAIALGVQGTMHGRQIVAQDIDDGTVNFLDQANAASDCLRGCNNLIQIGIPPFDGGKAQETALTSCKANVFHSSHMAGKKG
jgi:hypothetical protein